MKIKNIVSLTLAAALSFSSIVFGADKTEISVNGNALNNQVYTEHGTIMMPLRETAEKLGYTVTWHEDEKAATVDSKIVSANAFSGKNEYLSQSGYTSELNNEAVVIDGNMYVPEEFFLYYFFTKTEGQNLINYEPNEPKVLSEFAKTENVNWFGLTNEQMLEDFDYLYKALKENYPYFGTLKRMYGVDLDEEYNNSRKLVESCKSEAEFYSIIENFTRKANMVGHLSAIAPFDYDWYVETYNNLEGIPQYYWGQMKKLADAYGNELSTESYKRMGNIFWPVYDKVQAYYEAQENEETVVDEDDINSQEYKNVQTKIIEEGKTAYIAVNSFDMSCYTEDKKVLFDFYEQIKDYENVIFDFTMNGGGGMSYFDDLIVAPNIDKPLSADVYELVKAGSLNEEFIEVSTMDDISNLPELPKMNQDDLKELDAMLKNTYEVKPSNESKMLNGKIWILVSENVFSSSEYAAMFTKTTGFATLVGTQTGGDGIGSDPIPVVMPNSGLIVRYSPIYGITSDGTGSQEFGTTPDIISPEGEDALTTCLKAIDKK